jgi:hypothetical protein
MRTRHIVWKEIWHRKGSALLIVAGVALCVGLMVMFQRIGEGSTAEMREIMNRVGKNVVILPGEARLRDYLSGRLGEATFPQWYVGRAAKHQAGLAGHFQGSLQRRVEIEGQSLVLCGLTPENPSGLEEERSLARTLERGEAELGSSAAEALGIRQGELLILPFLGPGAAEAGPPPMGPPGGRPGPLGPRPKGQAQTVRVVRVREATGTVDDFKVYLDINLARELLGVEGDVINVVEAMAFVTETSQAKRMIQALSDEFEGMEPPVKVYQLKARAEVRRRTRWHNTTTMNYLSLGVFVLGTMIIGGLAVMNVRVRRKEVGVLLAIAARPRHVAWILAQKMALLAVLGGALGSWLGQRAALRWGPPILASLPFDVWTAYGQALLAALVLMLIPALVGTLIAAHVDPADTVRGL